MVALAHVPIGVTLSPQSVFGDEWVWIDLVVFAVFVVIHTAANWGSPGLSSDSDPRAQSFTFVQAIATGSATAVGILLPLSLAALGALSAKRTPAPNVLINIFVGDAWLTLSLALGIYVLWVIGFRAHSENVQNRRDVRLASGYQIGALLLGVVRFLIAAFFLVQHPT
jgi:hypothetical protein